MAFTTICPFCRNTLRLLRSYLDCKIMCPGCRKPFVAQNVRDEAIEIEDDEELPSEGWLLVCPACGHTELVANNGEQRTHCSQCGTALDAPTTASKTVRKKSEE